MAKSLTRKSLASAAAVLARRDPDLAVTLKANGVPPLWARPPGFETLVHIILEQQVSLASAAAVFRRLQETIQPLTPAKVVKAGVPGLRKLGFTRQKAAYCFHLAAAILEGRLDLKTLGTMKDAEAKAVLMQAKGIGTWTSDIYLLMALRRPDVWPSGDIALAAAARQVKKLRGRPTWEALAAVAEGWRPYRSVAARMLWQHYLAAKASV